MSPKAFAYVATGAGHEETLRENRAAFGRWRIVPRMLRDVSERDTSVELFGRRHALAVPARADRRARAGAPGGRAAVARAAAAAGVPMIVSNQASTPMEEVAAAARRRPRWFQLYWSATDELVESFVSRAEACGCEAIVVTLDTTLLGWRTRDLDHAYLPFLRGKGIAQYTSDPVFQRAHGRAAGRERRQRAAAEPARRWPRCVQMAATTPAARQRSAARAPRWSLRRRSSPARRSRGTTCRSCASGRRCRSCSRASSTPTTRAAPSTPGVDGIVVSNHGGRQVDGAIARWTRCRAWSRPSAARSRCCSTAASAAAPTSSRRWRSGPAPSCSAGPTSTGWHRRARPACGRCIRNFMAEFDLTMGLAGCRSIGEISRESLVRAA